MQITSVAAALHLGVDLTLNCEDTYTVPIVLF